MHLPLTTPGPASAVRPTMPSPYPPRRPFQPAPAPPPPQPRPRLERWEGTGFRPDIQGLRAVAVVLVLLSHAGFSFAEGGYVGVDVFFVLSGFLITSLLAKEIFDTGTISIAGFYARRARRILPAATAVTVATVVGAWLWFPITRFEAVMQDAFTVIVYVVNYRFVAESTEYLNADQMPSPFQQYWSLAVEEQFYVVWPLLLLGLLLWMKRMPRRTLHAAITVCVAVFVLSLIASVLVTESSQPTAYYAAHTRAWELAGGALLALTLPTWRKLPRAAAVIFGFVGLAAIVASGVHYTSATAFPGYTALLPVFGTMLVIVAGTPRSKNPVSSFLSTGPFQFVGKLSYSLYLWHWPILILAPLALGVESSLLLNLILLAGTFAVAQLSYEYIETPIRTKKPFKSNMAGLATGVLCSLLGIAMILTLTLAFSKVPEDDGPVDLDAVEETRGLSEIETKLDAGLDITEAPAVLTPSLTNVVNDRPKIYDGGDDSCHIEFEQTQWPEHCAFGDTDSDEIVMLIGDSHAAQWFPALEAIAQERGWKLLTRTKSSCTPVSVLVDNAQLGGEYTQCEQARQRVFDEIDRIRPAMVVLGGSETTMLTGVDEEDMTSAWLAGWSDTIERVGAASEHVVAIADTPWADDPVPDCVALHEDAVQECTIDQSEGIRLPERRAEAIELQHELGVTVVDPIGWFCIEAACPVIVDGMLVYRDSHHISTPYIRSLAALLEAELPRI